MDNLLRIERMAEEHLAAVYTMDTEISGKEAWPHEWFSESVADPNGYYYIAYWGGEPAGFGCMYHNQMTSESPGYCKIANLGVRPGFRLKGIGKALMTKMLDTANALGLDRAKLEVETTNPAIMLYEKFGFKIKELQKGYYHQTGGDAYIMWRCENG